MRTRSQRSSSVRRYAAPLDSVAGGSAVLRPIGRGVWVQAWTAPGVPSKATPRQRWLVLGVTLLAAFTLTLATLTWVDRPREADLSDLIAALPNPRPYAARLSGGFPYAPCERPAAGEYEIPKLVCAAAPTTREQQARLNALRDDFFRYAGHQPEARRRHLDALWTLTVEGTRGNLDRAIADLEAASKLEPESGAILSDLAAAFTARAAKTDDARDLVRALDAAERAAQASPEVPEALWNRAVAREVFVRRTHRESSAPRLGHQQEKAWWTEARTRAAAASEHQIAALQGEPQGLLENLISRRDHQRTTQAIRADPSAAESYLWKEMLTTWSRAALAGDAETARSRLAAAEWYSDLLSSLFSDSFYSAAVEALADGEDPPSETSRAQELASGYEHLQLGQSLFDENDYTFAEVHFARAAATFGPHANPLEPLARLGMVRCAYRTQRYSEALRLAVSSGAMAAARRWAALYGRYALTVGSAQHVQGQVPAAQATFEGALAELGRGDQPSLRAGLQGRLAAVLVDLGEPVAAWRHRLGALRAFQGFETSRDYPPALFEVAHGVLGLGAAQAARYLLSEAMLRATALSDPLLASIAFRNEAELLAKLDPRAAESALEASREELQGLRDERLRELAQRGIDVVEARHIERSEPSRCARILEAAIATYRRGPRILLPTALASGAHCLSLAGAAGEAESVLEEAFTEAEALAPTLQQGHLRRAFLETFDPILDELVDLKVRAGRAEEALSYADRSRSIALRASLGGRQGVADDHSRRRPAASKPGSSSSLLDALPEGVAIIEYKVKAEELLIWVCRRGVIELVATPVSRARIRLAVESLTERDRNEERLAKALAELYSALIGPIEAQLSGQDVLYLILDEELQEVPFAALFDPTTERFLVEGRSVVIAPSLSALRPADPAAGTRPGEPISVLALVNPSVDGAAFPSLSSLPGTEGEAAEIAALFGGSRIYRGLQASPMALRRHVALHPVLHIGAHALSSPGALLESRLILAPEMLGKDLGTVSGRDLLDMDLGGLRLAVLAACRSAGASSSEGVSGLAWPLLAKGVPQVIASNRLVDDRQSAGLFVDFYRMLRLTGNALDALRGSQMRRLADSQRSARAALEWGSIQLYSTELDIQ